MKIVEITKEPNCLTIPEMINGQGFMIGVGHYCVKAVQDYDTVIFDVKNNRVFVNFDSSVRYRLVDLEVVRKG